MSTQYLIIQCKLYAYIPAPGVPFLQVTNDNQIFPSQKLSPSTTQVYLSLVLQSNMHTYLTQIYRHNFTIKFILYILM